MAEELVKTPLTEEPVKTPLTEQPVKTPLTEEESDEEVSDESEIELIDLTLDNFIEQINGETNEKDLNDILGELQMKVIDMSKKIETVKNRLDDLKRSNTTEDGFFTIVVFYNNKEYKVSVKDSFTFKDLRNTLKATNSKVFKESSMKIQSFFFDKKLMNEHPKMQFKKWGIKKDSIITITNETPPKKERKSKPLIISVASSSSK